MIRYRIVDGAIDLDQQDYRNLEEFRFQIRAFLNFSERAAGELGLEPQQHQALLAIKATPDETLPTVGHLAQRLFLKHHSAVGLVDRLQKHGLISRSPSLEDARKVLLRLTPKAERILHKLSLAHRQELEQAGPKLEAALRAVRRGRERQHAQHT